MIGIVLALYVGQSITPSNGSDGTLLGINSNKAMQVVPGWSGRPTYTCAVASQNAQAARTLILDSSKTKRTRLVSICWGGGSGTSAASMTVTLKRYDAASTGAGSTTLESTTGGSTAVVSKFDRSDPDWDGVCSTTGSTGGTGTLLFTYSTVVGEHGAGAADPADVITCQDFPFGVSIQAGSSHSLALNLSATTGGLTTSQFLYMRFVAE